MPVPTTGEIWARLQPPVQRDLLRRAGNVVTRAQGNLRGQNGFPRRVRSGRLLGNVRVLGTTTLKRPFTHTVWIGTTLSYGRYVQRGTGIYGPRGQRIVPRRAQALRFHWDRTGQIEFFRSVRGMRPNPFLTDALQAARD